MGYKASNNAYSTLAGSLTNVATIATVAAGHGDRFPVIAGADFTYVTLENTGGTREIVKITARAAASDSMTIERAQEGTTAVAWNAGDAIELRLTALVVQTAMDHVDDTAAAHAASAIANTPAGGISATNVQDALNELDGDKQAVASKDASGGYPGLTLFKLNMRNAANTFTSWFTNAATAARTWTLPDKDGTVAMTSDITGTNSGTNTGDNAVNTLYSGLAASKQDASAKDASGGFAGLTLFKINFKNAANTFTNFLTNATTAARTWTFPDKDGTVAMTSDVPAQASTAEVLAESAVTKYISPDRLKNSERVAKAWVNFNGTGTVAIRDSVNVSSITDNGNGNWTVNFTSAMTDANYAAVASGGNSANTDRPGMLGPIDSGTYSTTAVQIKNLSLGGTAIDSTFVSVGVFGA